MSNDSVKKTLLVAFLLCFVCSILVSFSAVKLRPLQVQNQKLDIKKNLLLACGLLTNPKASKEEIQEAFESVQTLMVDLETGKVVTDVSADNFDVNKAHKDPKVNKKIDPKKDIAKLRTRSKLSKVYKIMESGRVSQIVLPVHGKGLWSTLYGFIALSPDTKTIQGLGFYQHGETPGLGGEIDNPKWKATWNGKVALNENYEPQIKIIKGRVDSSTPEKERKVDGLSGATITSVGVETMVNYWLGNDGYGKYLAAYRQNSAGGM